MTILQHATDKNNTNIINMQAFREYQAAMQRRRDTNLRCEPLAGRRDARRFNPYGF